MWVELTSKLMYKLWAVEWIRERSSDQNSFLYLEECCCFRDDASDPDLRFQRKRNRFDLWKVHLLVVGQQSLQTLCLLADTERKVQKNGLIPVQTLWSTGQMLTFFSLYYYLLFAIPTLSLHSLHQLHQFVYERLLGGQQRAHHSHTLISLKEIRVQVKQFLHQFVGLVVPNVACDKPVVMSLNCNFHQRPRPTALFSVTGN